MMNSGLEYSKFGGKRLILGKTIRDYLRGNAVRFRD